MPAQEVARFTRGPLNARCTSKTAAWRARGLWLYCAPADGSSQAKNLEIAPRQAPRAARHLRAAPQRLPELPPADSVTPDVPELQDLSRPRGRAAPRPDAVTP